MARRTLLLIAGILTMLLLGIAFIVRAYGITATVPGQAGYESVVSQVTSAVIGRGIFYYVTMAAVLMVLTLSANTSFADFPRVCRVLAVERYLPPEFARRGGRLVFTSGIVVLTTLTALLLIVFGGITDHLIPLFAVGALLAFTMSQLGMVAHWRRSTEPGRMPRLIMNATGAVTTTIALAIVLVSKFLDGAWITALIVLGFVVMFRRVKAYNDRLVAITRTEGPLDLSELEPPIIVIPLRRLDHVGRKALGFALAISPDVNVVQVDADELATENLEAQWQSTVEEPLRRNGHPPPKLVVLRSPYRRFFQPLLHWIERLTTTNPGRHVIVLLPELVHRRWYQFLIAHRVLRLRSYLLLNGGPRISVMSTPWYPDQVRRHTA